MTALHSYSRTGPSILLAVVLGDHDASGHAHQDVTARGAAGFDPAGRLSFVGVRPRLAPGEWGEHRRCARTIPYSGGPGLPAHRTGCPTSGRGADGITAAASQCWFRSYHAVDSGFRAVGIPFSTCHCWLFGSLILATDGWRGTWPAIESSSNVRVGRTAVRSGFSSTRRRRGPGRISNPSVIQDHHGLPHDQLSIP